MISKQAGTHYQFGPYQLDVAERLLLRDGQAVTLQPKVFDTLIALVENAGHLVSKDELMTRLWPDTFVEESTLARNISDLRKALSESPEGRSYIETIPRHGYRFLPSVTQLAPNHPTVIIERHTSSRILSREYDEDKPSVSLATAPSDAVALHSNVRLIRNTILVLGLICIVGIAFYLSKAPNSATADLLQLKSVAVLPFRALGEDSRDEYLGPGLSDALITRLANIRRITVRPTSAVLKYSSPEQDVVEAGRALKVEAVLEGRIQRSGELVRVTVQLVRVSDGSPIWASTYEEKATDNFWLQNSISQQVASELAANLTSEERARLARRQTESSEAYQAYVKGRYFWNNRSGKSIRKAIEYFEEAARLDPHYALAYAGLADCYVLMGPRAITTAGESFPKAKEAAARALELDEQLAEAHTSLAHVTWLYDWNWAAAEREFRRAIELNPNYATAHQWYSVFLSSMARHDEAIAEANRALELDPSSIPINEDVARSFYNARQYDRAIEATNKTRELNPNYHAIEGWLNLAYEKQGLYDQAIAERQKALAVISVEPGEIAALESAYRTGGWRGYWQKEREVSLERSKTRYVLPYNIAKTCARLGDVDQAFEWLERAYQQHSDHLTLLKVDPILDPLRSDPRYDNLLRRVGLEN